MVMAPCYRPATGRCNNSVYRVSRPAKPTDCERANALPMHHKDPMDRMLIASALDRAMTVITGDNVFASYGVSTIW
jgi:PIN domain nuclease of toxin-antitoxin system